MIFTTCCLVYVRENNLLWVNFNSREAAIRFLREIPEVKKFLIIKGSEDIQGMT